MSATPADPFPLPAELQTLSTLAGLFEWRVARTPQAQAYLAWEEAGQRWRSVSWLEAGHQVQRWRAALRCTGAAPGARVAILLPNSLHAVFMDQASLAEACVPVPLHAIDNPDSIAYVLADSDACLLVTATRAQWDAVAATGVALPSLRQVVVLDAGGAGASAPGAVQVATLAQWLAAGEQGEPLAARQPARAEDLAALVYTSGTTGKPKGVMLTHDNVLENVKATLQRVAARPDDVFLSFLPLSHTFERTAGYYLPIAAGCCVAHARSASALPEDMLAVRPTILISVPRIYERVFARVQALLAGSPLKARLFAWAQAVGWRRFSRTQALPLPAGAPPAALDALAWPLLQRLVARPLLAQFGGRLRVAVSGGAPLSQPIAHCFLGLGLPIVQGYGMTETSPVVSANAPEDNDPATVGRPLAGVEVRIGDNQELQVRGRSVMRGYWKRDEDTRAAFIDGWLRTGDQAALEGGRIRILGRVKEILVTSTGEKIAPVDVELAITADPLFEQACAFGDNRPFIACVVVLGRGGWARLAAELGLAADDPASLLAPAAVEAALQRIRTLTRALPHYAQPRAVALTLEPWTIENTLITPTLKLKRKNIAARFAADIERLYRR